LAALNRDLARKKLGPVMPIAREEWEKRSAEMRASPVNFWLLPSLQSAPPNVENGGEQWGSR